jgi:hypothetical protein
MCTKGPVRSRHTEESEEEGLTLELHDEGRHQDEETYDPGGEERGEVDHHAGSGDELVEERHTRPSSFELLGPARTSISTPTEAS